MSTSILYCSAPSHWNDVILNATRPVVRLAVSWARLAHPGVFRRAGAFRGASLPRLQIRLSGSPHNVVRVYLTGRSKCMLPASLPRLQFRLSGSPPQSGLGFTCRADRSVCYRPMAQRVCCAQVMPNLWNRPRKMALSEMSTETWRRILPKTTLLGAATRISADAATHPFPMVEPL